MKTIAAVKAAVGDSRMFLMLCFGISCGLPYILTKSPLQAWMTLSQVNLKTIGIFALVGLPYTLKFLWAPVVDHFVPPFLGRRRGWAMLFSVAAAFALLFLSMADPTQSLSQIAFLAVLLSFFGASQDIVVDAYRAELWSKEKDKLGLANSVHIGGYLASIRWVGNAMALVFADSMGWPNTFRVMACIQLLGAVSAFVAPEPPAMVGPDGLPAPKPTFAESVYMPLVDFFKRTYAVEFLIFILLYKLGDSLAGTLFTPFYLKMGFTQTEIGLVAKPIGIFATIGGGILGGILMLRFGTFKSLVGFGVLQALSTAAFAILTLTGPNLWALGSVIAFENLTSGMGTAAYATFMMSLCTASFTATQYALMTSFMAVPGSLIGASAGFLAEALGWGGFFFFGAVAAVPGILILGRYKKWQTVSDD